MWSQVGEPGSSSTRAARTLLDNGSSHDLVSRAWLRRSELESLSVKDKASSFRLTYPNGHVETSQLQTVVLQLEMHGYQRCVKFMVTDIKDFDIVLGRAWLFDENPHLNWRTNEVRLKYEGRTVTFVAITDFGVQRTLNTVEGSITAAQAKTYVEATKGAEIFAVLVRADDHKKSDPKYFVNSAGVRYGSVNPQIDELWREYEEMFPAKLPSGARDRGELNHAINTVPGQAAASGYTVRFTAEEHDRLQLLIAELVESGHISPSNSPFGAPCFFVKKPHGGGFRLVVDWRALNGMTIKDHHQLPNITDLIGQLFDARFYSVLDGHSSFWQIQVNKEDRFKTAFRTPFGSYQWNVMGMGLCNAPATYQRLMNSVLRPHLRQFVVVYLDDILMYSKTFNEHMQHLRTVLELLKANHIYMKPTKCILAAEEVFFLGSVVSAGCIRVDPDKIKAISDIHTLNNKAEVRTFLGMTSYLAAHLPKYASVSAPLRHISTKEAVFDLSNGALDAFKQLKHMVSSAPILRIPDPRQPLKIACDANDLNTGAVLLQQLNGTGPWLPCSYYSYQFKGAELRWATRDKECSSMLLAIKHWSYLLKGIHFVVETDHHSLQHLRQQRDISELAQRQERLLDTLATYDFDVKYIPGPSNGGADGLSRLPGPALPSPVEATLSNITATIADPVFIEQVANGYDDGVQLFKRILAQIAKGNAGASGRWFVDERGLLWLQDLLEAKPRLCIPTATLQLQLLKMAHDTDFSNHRARDATLQR